MPYADAERLNPLTEDGAWLLHLLTHHGLPVTHETPWIIGALLHHRHHVAVASGASELLVPHFHAWPRVMRVPQ